MSALTVPLVCLGDPTSQCAGGEGALKLVWPMGLGCKWLGVQNAPQRVVVGPRFQLLPSGLPEIQERQRDKWAKLDTTG